MEDFFQDLHVLSTHVPNIQEYWVLQIALSWLKENICDELEFLYNKDIEQARQKAKITEKKLKVYKKTSFCSLKYSISKYITPHKRTLPPNTRLLEYSPVLRVGGESILSTIYHFQP